MTGIFGYLVGIVVIKPAFGSGRLRSAVASTRYGLDGALEKAKNKLY